MNVFGRPNSMVLQVGKLIFQSRSVSKEDLRSAFPRRPIAAIKIAEALVRAGDFQKDGEIFFYEEELPSRNYNYFIFTS